VKDDTWVYPDHPNEKYPIQKKELKQIFARAHSLKEKLSEVMFGGNKDRLTLRELDRRFL